MPLDFYFALVALAVATMAGFTLLTSRLASPARGLGLLIIAAVLLPIEGGEGNINASVLLTAFLCGVWLLRQVIVERRFALDGSPVVVATLVFLATAILAFIVGQYPWFGLMSAPMRAQIGGLAVFLLSGGLFLFVGHRVDTIQGLQRIVWVFVFVGLLELSILLLPGLEAAVGLVSVTNTQTLGSLFFVWIVAMTFSQALSNRDLSSAKRLAILAIGVLALARGLVWAISWVSGWLPPLVALAVVLLVSFPRLAVGGALLLTAPAMAMVDHVAGAVQAGEEYSWMTRIEALKVMMRLISESPWLGFGPANYHFYTPLFPFRGYPAMFSSHNNYVDLLAQVGVIGLGAFCWFVVEVARLARGLYLRTSDGFARAYVVGAVGGLVGSLSAGWLADWIIPFTYNIGLSGFRSSLLFWLFLGGLLALKRMPHATALPDDVWAPARRRPLPG